jgi:glyoxylase-like metal-dependent hydrolase (beta-lactamase superfamily II)
MSCELTIVSIGTTSHNLLWDEQAAVRTAHATTSLLRDESRTILVDPSLPANLLVGRLYERTGKGPEQVTDVFCTTLRPEARRGLEAFAHANWWAHEEELAWYNQHLETLSDTADRLGSDDLATAAEEIELLRRFKPAPETFGESVTTYPLFGATPGCSGLLVANPIETIVVAGPAVVTGEHLRRGMVWEQSHDTDQAMESLSDLLELADVVVPGFDNITIVPGRQVG